jgi:hypothetical protein
LGRFSRSISSRPYGARGRNNRDATSGTRRIGFS